ncbi:MAG: Flp pilus assembly complex ATPase component TadA [Elusimicrobia bacterium]|nr:Flp pilus assembly complex ATPase component TadA [Elusimicrobiota bacterium]
MQRYGRKKIGEILLKQKVLTAEQLESVLSEEQRTGDSLFRILPRMRLVTADQLADIIAEQAGVPRMELGNMIIDKAIATLIPEELARKHNVIPVLKIANTLTCAMVDIFNVHVIDEIALKTGMTVDPGVATEEEVEKALEDIYVEKADMAVVIETLNKQETPTFSMDTAVDVFDLKDAGDEHPVVRFVNMMLAKAVTEGASDVHLEPEEESLEVRFRIDGILHRQAPPPKQVREAITSRLKIMANMDIAEKRKPQDGRIQMQIEQRRIDVRVSVLPTVYGENVVMRLLDTGNIRIGLDQIGMDGATLEKYRALLRRPNGIILVTGPTGSGKTTTLYSSIGTINTPDKSIVTIEDPVEYHLPGIRQTQVDAKVDLTFAKGLRAILRQDPDIVMIGEIRDTETAQIAIQAALTGHLVLATLHTNNAAGAITRLLDIGVEPFLLSSSIIGVMAQRLVRLICRECGGKGCQACQKTGYKGRSGIYELLIFDEKFRELVQRKASTEEVHRAAVSSGMQSLRDNGLSRVEQGITTREEVVRVTQDE